MKRALMILSCLILLSVNVSANFQLGNASYSVESQYGPSDNIRGWVNISFADEPADSVFSDSFGNEISLSNLLRNQTYDYACNTQDCSSDYSGINPSTSKSFSLGVGDSKIIGIKLNNEITKVSSISFSINSNAGQSCFNQITVDFFNDGIKDSGNSKSTFGDCPLKSYGCFDDEATLNEYIIGKSPNKHCQRINLSESPGFKIGAWIKRNGDTRNITAALYNLNGEQIKTCILPNVTEGEASCEFDYLIATTQEYYVCIYSNVDGTSKVRGYSSPNGCGFYGTSFSTNNAAFQIFAEGKKFDSPGIISIMNILPNEEKLGTKTEEYLFEKYGGLDCSGGCIIPVRINSQANQEITVDNLKAEYVTDLGPTIENNFYEITETPAKINSAVQKLSLNNGGFKVPSEYGEGIFTLSLNNEELLSQNIIIEEVPVISYINPSRTASAYPTLFRAVTNSKSNITEYEWDFGDGDIQKTLINQITHTYNATGKYNLKVTVSDNSQRSSYKIFEVSVESPKEIINASLSKMQIDFGKVNEQLAAYPAFEQASLKKVLNLNEMSDRLKEAQKNYKEATSEGDYNKIMGEILEIKIPESIVISIKATDMTFYPEEKNINLDVLKKISKDDYDVAKEKNYLIGVISWYQENIDSKLNFKEFSAKYESHEEPILRTFELSLNRKDSASNDVYIIIKDLEEMTFKENSFDEESGYVYAELPKEGKNFAFSTTEDVTFANLQMFVSPEISRIPVVELVEGEQKFNWKKFMIIITILVIVGFAVYIFLQEWYKRKYENYLFKNRNDLYNLVNYVNSSRNKGVVDNKIEQGLKKAGWNSEQVNYAMKKYEGKRTGMFEIPVFKIFDLLRGVNVFDKKKEAVQKPTTGFPIKR